MNLSNLKNNELLTHFSLVIQKEKGMMKKNGTANKRYIPQEIRRKVWKRDNGKCTFQSRDGKQCNEQGMLELDHVRPLALNGKNEVENLRLICSSHNKWRAQKTFGSFLR